MISVEDPNHNNDLTVVIPVRNGLPHLPYAVESILNQTFEQFELLVVDDGSTDGTLAWLRTIRDRRLRIVSHPNKGLCRAFNEAVAGITTKYLARLDHDDLSFPHRLLAQRNFLEENQSYVAVLGNSERIGENNKNFGPTLPFDPAQPSCRYSSKTFGCIPNSTLMIRLDTFKKLGGYREFMFPVDDYDLLLRLEEVANIAVLTAPMVKYRISSQGVTFKTYSLMQWKTRLAHENSQRRGMGERELMPEEFLRLEKDRALLTKISVALASWGRLSFRKAGLQIANDRYCKGVLWLMVAGLLGPTYVVKRLANMLKNTSAW